jgi:hypothetical protein
MSDTLKVVTLLGSGKAHQARVSLFGARLRIRQAAPALFTIIFPDLQRPDIRGDGLAGHHDAKEHSCLIR